MCAVYGFTIMKFRLSLLWKEEKYVQCTLKSLEVSKSKKDPSLLAVIQLIAGIDNHNHSRVVEMKVLDELSSPCSMNENILIY